MSKSKFSPAKTGKSQVTINKSQVKIGRLQIKKEHTSQVPRKSLVKTIIYSEISISICASNVRVTCEDGFSKQISIHLECLLDAFILDFLRSHLPKIHEVRINGL